MTTVVVYYSKTGNTKTIADVIAEETNCKTFALNIMKKGKKTKEEKAIEEKTFADAVEYSNKADIVFIGTPTEFRKPHEKIVTFINAIHARKVALFCTYYGMLGATLIDLETLCRKKDIPITGMIDICIGTEKYKFRQTINDYVEKITESHIQQAENFALKCLHNHETVPVRLIGVCGKKCMSCVSFQKKCKGAGYQCWSGKDCEIFNCCIIKKSLKECLQCHEYAKCEKQKKNDM